MYKIVGIKENAGTIDKGKPTEKNWKNYDLHCIHLPNKEVPGLSGYGVKVIRKVSETVFNDFAEEVGGAVLECLVNIDSDIVTFNGVEKIVITDIIPVEG